MKKTFYHAQLTNPFVLVTLAITIVALCYIAASATFRDSDKPNDPNLLCYDNVRFQTSKRCFCFQDGKMLKDDEICIASANRIDICLSHRDGFVFYGSKHGHDYPLIPGGHECFFRNIDHPGNISAETIKALPTPDLPNIQVCTVPQYIHFQTSKGVKGLICVNKIKPYECTVDIKIVK